ncbi:hypothetical protein QAD02_020113 [Eretmocerus hayati]|uniref:Uncharacterized protein n=1 Tax=Eretmocerus hayati TaxID=131215 RepID=A0ACC2PLG4_9HYME|nr:hypothetical protein QAD02_020113 [Eretmocerus hayati]
MYYVLCPTSSSIEGKVKHVCRVGKDQHLSMIRHMEDDKLFARNLVTTMGPMGNKHSQKKWGDLANRLNKMGPAIRSSKQWKNYWKNCRLQAKARKNKFLKAYNRSGHIDPGLEVSDEDNRIVNIFGVPGLGWSIIPECGFKERELRATREQMETLMLYCIQEPWFASLLEDQAKWDEILFMLHSKIGPQFSQEKWKSVYLAEIREILQVKDSIGTDNLDGYQSLVYEAYMSAERAAEKMEYDGGSVENFINEDGTITLSSDDETEDEDTEMTTSGLRRNDTEARNNCTIAKESDQSSTMQEHGKANHTQAPSANNQLLATFRYELQISIARMADEVDRKITRSREQLEMYIDGEVRTAIREAVANTRARNEEKNAAVMKSLEIVDQAITTAVESTNSDCEQAFKKIIGSVAGSAAHMALSMLEDVSSQDKSESTTK